MTRLLLSDSTDRAAVERVALEAGLLLVNILGRSGGRPHQVMFASADGKALIALIDDHRIAARYLVIQGLDVDPIVERLASALPHLSETEVLARIDDPESRVKAIAWLGLVAPSEPAEPIRTILEAALAGDDPRSEAAARFAWEAAGWPEGAS